MEDSDSQAPQIPQTKSDDIAEHRTPEPQAVPPDPDQATVELDEGQGDAADPGGGRSLRTHKAARSVKSASTRAAKPGPGRSLREAVHAAESRARRTFPGRAR